jgi:hypothetical protein
MKLCTGSNVHHDTATALNIYIDSGLMILGVTLFDPSTCHSIERSKWGDSYI